MIKCQNCGNINTAESKFCRFCGTKFLSAQPAPAPSQPPSYDFEAPRPYVWKTDEFSTQNEARRTVGGTSRVGPLGQTSPFGSDRPQPLAYRQPDQLSQPYRCPHCMSQFLPRVERRISTAGWITFAVLLVFFFPLFWIGLLIKEDVRICPSCQTQVG
jgi:RNA polymerase subunit RPABC4/transcription elongation factor Spt4